MCVIFLLYFGVLITIEWKPKAPYLNFSLKSKAETMSFQLKYKYSIIIIGKGKGDMTIISQGIIFTKCTLRQSIFLHTME